MPRLRAVFVVPTLAILIAAGVSVALFACGGGESPPATASPAPPPPAGLFPVRIEQRYLVDASGNPFLLHIDTAWSLIADLSKEDAEVYLEDRRQKGFNAIVVNLLERKFSSNAMNNFSNFYNQPPFTTTDDYATPNPDYFAHADYVIQLAASKGILVLLVPSYLGFNGGAEGWYVAMQSNAAKMRDYGRFLGQRYASYTNILWMHGGDFNPVGNEQLVRDIALGIKEFDTVSQHSAHCAPETSALDFWVGETWLQVNNIYTYVDVPAKAQAADASPMPFFLFESGYENEQNPVVDEQRVRAEAYQALLSGAMGQAFGNHPMWHFDGPGVFADPVPANWEAWLDSAGAQSMVHVRSLLSARAWWTLVPDHLNTFLTASGSGQFDLAVAAKAGDSSFAVAYVPSA